MVFGVWPVVQGGVKAFCWDQVTLYRRVLCTAVGPQILMVKMLASYSSGLRPDPNRAWARYLSCLNDKKSVHHQAISSPEGVAKPVWCRWAETQHFSNRNLLLTLYFLPRAGARAGLRKGHPAQGWAENQTVDPFQCKETENRLKRRRKTWRLGLLLRCLLLSFLLFGEGCSSIGCNLR